MLVIVPDTNVPGDHKVTVDVTIQLP
ncbi:c protein alpha-antigen precursor, partial [Streptococcus agalactiae 515]